MSPEPDDRDAALRANLATYTEFDERAYVNGAPHLKHTSIGRIYVGLVRDATQAVGRPASEISVLELGAGNGLASLPWLELGVKLTAVDSSREMLQRLAERSRRHGTETTTVVAEAGDYLAASRQRFDIVTHVSMLHHVPDYAELLRASASRTRAGGALLTFQDPLRYDTMPRWQHTADRAAYFAWRLGQGNYKRGLKTRWRRLRGVYAETETVDFDEYHVVRNGVDSDAIVDLLGERFTKVTMIAYWSTYSPLLQAAGERLGLTSSFGVLATGRKPVAQE